VLWFNKVVTGRKRVIMKKTLNAAALLLWFASFSIFFFSLSHHAAAEDAGMCMSCHGTDGQFMQFKSNEKASVFVRQSDIEKSVHKAITCTGCHTDISMQNHPGKTFASKKDFVLTASRACRTCHDDEKLKAKPNHAFVVERADAPPCTVCHSAHQVQKLASLKSSLPGNAYCLSCHRMKLSKTHTSGEVLSLQIDPANLSASVHNKHACNDCHAGFSQDAHPKITSASSREHTIIVSDACRKCHGDKAALVKGSIHYNLSFQVGDALIKRGNLKAPVCTDCHGFHTVGPKDSYETISGAPCRKCHEDIFAIYGKSVHGVAQARGEHKAPLCSSCHFAHEVGFTAMTDKMKSVCLGCHKGVEALHGKWLPNAELHLSMIACAACHAPASGKGIYLQVVDRNTGNQISEDKILALLGTDSAALAERLNAHGEGIDSGELSYILKQLNKKGAKVNISFIGKMDVSKYSEAHQLSIKKNAVRECESCHSKDSKFFRTVTLAVIKADGRVATFSAQTGTIGSLGAAGTTGNFYVLGGTRITILDWLGMLMVVGGMLFPLAHISLRMMTVRLRKAVKPHAHGAEKIYLHPLTVRIWHWTNAIAFVFLIFTAIQLRYYDIANITQFKSSVTLHNIFGIVMALGYVLWFCYYIFTGKIKLYIPLLNPKEFILGCMLQAKYYGYGIFKGEPNPHHASPDSKFNPLQQTAYFFVMIVLFPVQIITGILLLDVKRFSSIIGMFGGLAFIDIIHVVVSFAFVAFLFVHIYLTLLGATTMQHIKAMITGYEKEG
jgi:predicted CXXCH cytochrome family protein